MSKSGIRESSHVIHQQGDASAHFTHQDHVSQVGMRVKMINGEPHFYEEDVRRIICEEIQQLPKETRPMVAAAQDANAIIRELTDGIGHQMEKFQVDVKLYLEDIRQSRFAMVSETAAIMNPLKEIRQFFLGGDYKEQIERLKEFVDLCERLQKLKQDGFLDKVADTMLQLDR